MYNTNNIFAKIIRNEIPAKQIYSNSNALSFYDINPQAKIHALVIPKGEYVDILDFSLNASQDEMKDFFDAVNTTIVALGLCANNGFRTISNTGLNGGQEVPHFHMHILGGEHLGKMIIK